MRKAFLIYVEIYWREADEFDWGGVKLSIFGVKITLMVFVGSTPSAGGCCRRTLSFGTPLFRK